MARSGITWVNATHPLWIDGAIITELREIDQLGIECLHQRCLVLRSMVNLALPTLWNIVGDTHQADSVL
jgi:hypothetical protein